MLLVVLVLLVVLLPVLVQPQRLQVLLPQLLLSVQLPHW
ncbi:hypothetical protein C3B79_3016 [Aeromonas hydrophila]|nr:hypothetical protein C3B79_3016 [Aeromonas hydrophila]